MNTPETVALLMLSRDERLDTGRMVNPHIAPLDAGTKPRPTPRGSGLKRWLLSLVNG